MQGEIFRVESVGGANYIGRVNLSPVETDVTMTEAFQLLQGISPQGIQLMCIPFGDFGQDITLTPAAVVRASEDELKVYLSAKANMAGILTPANSGGILRP